MYFSWRLQDVVMSGFTSRAQKILAIVPKCNVPSDHEDGSSDEEVTEEQLESGIQNFFDYLHEDFDGILDETHHTTPALEAFEDVVMDDQQQQPVDDVYATTMQIDGEAGEDISIPELKDIAGTSGAATAHRDGQPRTSSTRGSSKKEKLQNGAKPMKGFKTKKRSKRRCTKKKKDKPRPTFNWQRGVPFLHEVTGVLRYDSSSGGPTSTSSVREPIEYFSQLFKEDLVDHIINQTNLYAAQKQTDEQLNPKKRNKKNSDPDSRAKFEFIDRYDVYDCLAIEILTGIVQFPSMEDPWSQNLRFERVAGIMSVKRYKAIRRHLHFNDNKDEPSDDPYFKVRPLVEKLRESFLAIPDEEKQSIDEMMIPYKGTRAGSRRQFMKEKPVKWGLKLFVRSGVSGILYDFYIYGGPKTFDRIAFTPREQKFGVSAQAVVALCKTIPNPQLKFIFFDNYYSSPGLLTYLRDEYGLLALGTVRTNRFPGLDFIDDKKLKKRGRGSFDTLVENDKKLVAVKWIFTVMGLFYNM